MATFPLAWTDAAPDCLTGGAISIGNFDGVHRGHRTLLAALVRKAKLVNGPAVAITFDPPPVALLNPPALKAPLTTIPQRATLLHEAGADHVIVLKVDASLLALSAPAFAEDVIQKQLNAKAIVEGSNFRFGRQREGDCDYLRTLGYRFEAVPVDDVSSSRVRGAINAGDVAQAAELLARPYAIIGTVIEGAKRGRTIGVPTANLESIPTLVPAPGVYAVRVIVNGKAWPAAANIGANPTFGDDARKVEVHLLGFNGDLYGQSLAVSFTKRLRDTVKFESVDALKVQLTNDLEAARQVLS